MKDVVDHCLDSLRLDVLRSVSNRDAKSLATCGETRCRPRLLTLSRFEISRSLRRGAFEECFENGVPCLVLENLDHVVVLVEAEHMLEIR